MNPSNLTRKFLATGNSNMIDYLNRLINNGDTHLIPEANELFNKQEKSINDIVMLERLQLLNADYLD